MIAANHEQLVIEPFPTKLGHIQWNHNGGGPWCPDTVTCNTGDYFADENNLPFTPTFRKEIQDSLGFWIPQLGFLITGTGF